MPALSPSAVIIICIIFFILFNPSVQVNYGQEEEIAEAVAKERSNLQVLVNTTYGDFAPWDTEDPRWLNMTGLREGDGYKWDVLPGAQARAREQLQYATGGEGLGILQGQSNTSLLLYHNVSGWLRGQWIRSNAGEDVSTPIFNLSNIIPDMTYNSLVYGRNITGVEGKVEIKLDERQQVTDNQEAGATNWLTARITIQDDTSYADGWSATLYGIVHLDSGSILMTTTSEKFAGIFALPHFSLTPHFSELARRSLNSSLSDTIKKQEDDPTGASINPWKTTRMEEEDPFVPLCDMVVYLQQHLLDVTSPNEDPPTPAELEGMEQELRFPSGSSYSHPQDLTMSMLVYSPDCGFIIESKGPPTTEPPEANHLQGPKIEVYLTGAKHAILSFALVTTGQLLLLVQQMKTSTTPSTRSRISFYTLAMMSLGTGFAAFAFLLVSSFLASMYLTSMIVAFLLFLEGNFFGVKFLMDVWTAQEPERSERQRRRQERVAAVPTVAVTPQTVSASSPPQTEPPQTEPLNLPANTLPLPVTAPQPAIPFAATLANPLAQATPAPPATTTTPVPSRPATFGAFYTRYCLLLFFLIFLSIHAATSWPLTARTFYANTLTLLYLSFWTPQIHRNIVRNCRKAFTFRYVLGQSTLRLLPIAYLWCYDDNILFVEPDRRIFAGYVVWMCVQVLVLAGQEVLGPRWCVRESWSWVPAAWEYHPVLREDEEGATMPIGYSASSPLDEEPGLGSPSSPEARLRRASSVVSGSEGPTLSPTSTHEERRRHGTSQHRGRNTGTRSFDCAICMQTVEAPVVPSGDDARGTDDRHQYEHRRASTDTDRGAAHATASESAGLLSGLGRSALGSAIGCGMAWGVGGRAGAGGMTGGIGGRLLLERQRREYMVTPCRHIFHTACLEGWMGYRLQCPICRETLPPL